MNKENKLKSLQIAKSITLILCCFCFFHCFLSNCDVFRFVLLFLIFQQPPSTLHASSICNNVILCVQCCVKNEEYKKKIAENMLYRVEFERKKSTYLRSSNQHRSLNTANSGQFKKKSKRNNDRKNSIRAI